jgi:hypothetical protein
MVAKAGKRSWGTGTTTATEPLPSVPYTLGYIDLPPAPKSIPPPPTAPETLPQHADEDEPLTSPAAGSSDVRARELAAARAGELAWVRAGGVLRDAQGRFDKERTAAARAALDRHAAVARAWAIWDAYEERWRALLAARHDPGSGSPGMSTLSLSDDGELGWSDVPWPTEADTVDWMEREEDRKKRDRNGRGSSWAQPRGMALFGLRSNAPLIAPAAGQPAVPVSAARRGQTKLTPETIDAFVLSPVTTARTHSSDTPPDAAVDVYATSLAVDVDTASARTPASAHHRIRREMLRWHPDKFDIAVLPRVRESEQERVREGVGVVWRWLSEQSARERTKGKVDE